MPMAKDPGNIDSYVNEKGPDTERSIKNPPSFCEYAGGPCDQSFEKVISSDGLFLYPSDPPLIAKTIDEAIRKKGSWKNCDLLWCAQRLQAKQGAFGP
jgi:hypothetical protein